MREHARFWKVSPFGRAPVFLLPVRAQLPEGRPAGSAQPAQILKAHMSALQLRSRCASLHTSALQPHSGSAGLDDASGTWQESVLCRRPPGAALPRRPLDRCLRPSIQKLVLPVLSIRCSYASSSRPCSPMSSSVAHMFGRWLRSRRRFFEWRVQPHSCQHGILFPCGHSLLHIDWR